MENVYSQAKIFHFRDKLSSLMDKEVTPPIHVRVKPMNRCNHRCFYCCYRNSNLYLNELFKEKDMIPREKMMAIVRDLVEMGVKAVTFTGGGEPLIYPYIAETVSYLIEHEVKVAVLTNGSALQGDTAKHLAQGASWVRISIDAADRNTFAKSRNVKLEEFDKVMKNIDAFAGMKNDDCELGINLIVTELNFHRVYDFIGLMKSKGANHVKVCGCVVSTDGHENNVYHASYFDQVMLQINRAEADYSCESFHVINKFHNLEDKFDKRYSWCPFINFLNVIAADLCVYTCQDKAYTKTGFLGLIREQSLRELWQSDEYKERLHSINPSIICDHHCVQHEKNLALLDYLTTDTRHLEFV